LLKKLELVGLFSKLKQGFVLNYYAWITLKKTQ